MTRFNDALGKIPLIAGVYANKSYKKMVEEVKILKEEGIDGIYLENVNDFNDSKEGATQLLNILGVLCYVNCKKDKIGVNIMSNEDIDGYKSSIYLAKKFELPFIINDMIVGKYSVGGKTVELDSVKLFFSIAHNQNVSFNTLTIGGIVPPYATLIDGDEKELISDAREISDAIMVKARSAEKYVPLERVLDYKKIDDDHMSNTPVIVASKINQGNIVDYLGIADGFIIGSALRDKESNLHVPTIRELVKIVSDYRSALR